MCLPHARTRLLLPLDDDTVVTEREHREEERDQYQGDLVDEFGDLVESTVACFDGIDELFDTDETVDGSEDECHDEGDEHEGTDDLSTSQVVHQRDDPEDLTDGAVHAHHIGLDDIP